MKKTIYIIIGVALVGLATYTLINNKKKNAEDTAIVGEKNTSVAVRVATVSTGKIDADFVANGIFAPAQELNFSAESPGRVMKVLVDEGSSVRIGQTLAIIKGDKLNVDVQSAEMAYQTALTDTKRFENAYQTGGVTKQQVDNAKLNLSNARARLQQTKIALGDANIKSTINGIVNKKFIESGSVVSAGTQLFELVNVSSLKLKVNVTENQIIQLKIGSPVKVKASVYPDKEFKGKVTFIAPKADASLNFPVEIQIANNPNNEIKAGMYGTATFGSSASAQLEIKMIPRNAFVGSVSSNQVFVVNNNVATLKKIVAGRIFGDKVEILDGLNDGDVVVTSGQINLSDNTKVSIVK
ncbi:MULTISPECIES: efflux RND transporter periplasmic adaptor subunit [unclassified Flavobacterium]|jgi:RND family efflux transporter MFP subunit|uniref:efflux RND transporter periplasmic adaptor subunit n=1 Tax=unclassified Flavobacterium TaxID=196869 RepID=UPI0025C0E34E|nr:MULTISPECIES: efflux RND transporter periplasmic adaptor subunit [unclassified Flavobacterium]